MRIIRNLLLSALVAAFALSAASCGTTEGFGKDMEAGGKAIKDSAREHSD